jgi:hypothetical protein
MSARDHVHRLIDELPVLRALLEAPLDDEPETEEERCAVQEAREELARGKVRTLEEVRRELGQ